MSTRTNIRRGKARYSTLLPLTAAIAGLAVALPVPVLADELPYGPDTCIQGYVWREARGGDTVCVTSATRDATAQQNANAAQNREPNGGAYGPDTCKSGFVWREAFGGDHVCVSPPVRDQAAGDNAAAQSRYQRNHSSPPPAPRPEDKGAPDPGPQEIPTRGGSGGGSGGGDSDLGNLDACSPTDLERAAGRSVSDVCELVPNPNDFPH